MWQSMTHPNIQPFIGMDLRTFGTYPCMVSPWQDNGNIVECLERIREDMRFLVYCDEWVCCIHSFFSFLPVWLTSIIDKANCTGSGVSAQERHCPW